MWEEVEGSRKSSEEWGQGAQDRLGQIRRGCVVEFPVTMVPRASQESVWTWLRSAPR